MSQQKKPLIVAAGSGLFVGLVLGAALMWASSSRGVTSCPPSMVTVAVAVEPISAGTELTDSLVAHRDMPSTFVTSSIVPAAMASRVVGQKLLVDLQRGDPLLWSQFAPASSDPASSGVGTPAEVALPVE